MSWLDDVLGNPSEKPVRKTVPLDVPVKKPEKKAEPVKTEPEKKPEPQAKPAEPAKTEPAQKPAKAAEPVKTEPEKKPEPQAKPVEPVKKPPEIIVDSPKKQRKVEPPVITNPDKSAPSKADLKEALRKQNEVDAKMSVNVPLSQLYAHLSTDDKLRLIFKDPSASDVIWRIIGCAVERNSDAILDQWGEKLLKVAMECDDLRGKLISSIIKNDAWAEVFCDAFDENEPELTSDEVRDFAKDMLEEDPDSMKIFIDVLMSSPKGRKLLYDAINS